MAIIRLFKIAAAAILGFKNFKFLTVGTVKKVELHQYAKFHGNRSNGGRDVSFNIMLVWLENAYSRPFWVFWALFPQMVPLIVLTPQKTIPGLNHVIRAINSKYLPIDF